MKRRCLAIDIGASSGRHIVGWVENGALQTKECYRFPNRMEQQGGHLVWDVERLLLEVKRGIAAAVDAYGVIDSLSIDTWGVDYVLLNGDEPILPCYAYRDNRTGAAIAQVHERVPFPTLYRRTGIQFQPFNTVYQLYADQPAGRLGQATDFLMLPEYLMYRLTGVKRKEYTNATTTGLVCAETGAFDMDIIRHLGLPVRLFPTLDCPGEPVGEYAGIRVVLCATHDTASAVEGIPMDENAPYISSGTWSLLGVKTEKPITDDASQWDNFSNEGGVGYNRYQKNIMGLWLVQRLREELCPQKGFAEIARAAEESRFDGCVDVSDAAFLSPTSMRAAFDAALGKQPGEQAGYFRCAYRSLAASYKAALDELERNTGRKYDKLYIVGGGAKNEFLNRLVAEATGKEVIALPIEATALGNLKMQLEGNNG